MSIQLFVEMLKSREGYVVLDTETTGLNNEAEVCQIAVAASSGDVLLDTLVKPSKPIPAEATAIHCITDEMVESAPSWVEVRSRLYGLLYGRNVVIYNAEYDFRILCQSDWAAGLNRGDWRAVNKFYCAMKVFAEIYGDWNDYHRSYRWQRLETAARYYKIPTSHAHTALGDVLTTLEVCRKIAASH